jgi:chemotaxis methyl-accepting protein methylase/signal transduction histidine kinase/chemotaxis response regulator CheB
MDEGDCLIDEPTDPGVPRPAVIPVAGIGASAGGLEVLQLLLADLPAGAGLAIVFVSHLDPKHHSMLAEILAQTTPMPVSEASDGVTVEANHVYVMPSNADLTIAQGALRLAPRAPSPAPHMPIDRFLRSLADQCGSAAIGVILSGTGSDGSAGIEAVKAAGGVTFAQDPASARFAAMPQAAVATGCVDFVLPPKRIAAELVRIGRHPYMAAASPAEPQPAPAAEEERFGAIVAMLRGATGIDFSLYREAMVQRRILRRLALRNIDGLAEYSRRLENDPDELAALQRDLLIGVTSFFRGPGSFESLKKIVFPHILQGRSPNAPIRVWVAGCATGEEAFSIAISLQEYMDETGAAFPVRIFATDISLPAIEKARCGRYPENIAGDLTHERLNRYFTRIEGGYEVGKNLREMCVFTRHNLIDDPQFSKLDLISCRNVLIYLGSVQKNIVPLFHQALKPTGFLMLGASETVGSADLFSVVDREHRIYARRETARKTHRLHLGAAGRPAEPPDAPPQGDPRDRQISRLKRQLAAARQQLLSGIEEQQTSREESQYTTDQALSANEELQSLNQELEAAQEELQSTNEELITVNDELEAKNAALTQARDFAMSIVETVRQPLLVLDTELRIRMANQAFCRTFQVSPREAEGELVYSLARGSWDLPGLRDALDGLLQGGLSFPDFEVEREFAGVGHRTLVLAGCRIHHLSMILLAVDDISERRLAQHALRVSEEHLRQSQKMEAVGRLAGGIAHDFNNLLTAIIGYSDLLQDTLAGNPPAVQQVLEIKSAGERAAALTQQLLSFSRRQVLQPKVLDLNVIVGDFERMLRRLVGERIQVAVACAPGLWQVRADPGEIGRAIMNLSLNARDAMPDGGTLAIETANATLSAADTSVQDLAPGRYAVLTVRDSGVGMDAEMQAHLFEPFFTTKETGKGTGLGLATVLGIVEQSGGTIRCQSELGRGTTFRIFLPAVEALDNGAGPAGGLVKAPKGSEVILVVEDEDAVRKLARTILETSGYLVLEARNGREGLALCQAHQGPIHLLVTDVVMPELGGRELAQGVLRLRPGVKVVFLSGHTQDIVLKEGVKKGTAFLRKPFSPVELTQKVRQALDSGVRLAG